MDCPWFFSSLSPPLPLPSIARHKLLTLANGHPTSDVNEELASWDVSAFRFFDRARLLNPREEILKGFVIQHREILARCLWLPFAVSSPPTVLPGRLCFSLSGLDLFCGDLDLGRFIPSLAFKKTVELALLRSELGGLLLSPELPGGKPNSFNDRVTDLTAAGIHLTAARKAVRWGKTRHISHLVTCIWGSIVVKLVPFSKLSKNEAHLPFFCLKKNPSYSCSDLCLASQEFSFWGSPPNCNRRKAKSDHFCLGIFCSSQNIQQVLERLGELAKDPLALGSGNSSSSEKEGGTVKMRREKSGREKGKERRENEKRERKGKGGREGEGKGEGKWARGRKQRKEEARKEREKGEKEEWEGGKQGRKRKNENGGREGGRENERKERRKEKRKGEGGGRKEGNEKGRRKEGKK
ncbi:High mobility group nucleosome-binding domain-containing protein 5, partial [Ophiophagus hannah]